MQRLRYILLLFLFPFSLSSQPVDPQDAIISVENIWGRAPHSAFTDLIIFKEKFYCTFREGSGHIPGTNGTVRIISSADGQNWTSVASLALPGVDLRDPKLSVTPGGKIMVVIGGSVYDGSTLLRRDPLVSFSDTEGADFSVPEKLYIPENIRTELDWLWRVTWYEGKGYGVVYQPVNDHWGIHLVSTEDGIHYDHIAKWDIDGKPNETTLRFMADGTMVALVRRESEDKMGWAGQSSYPYREWKFKPLSERLGGPNFLILEDGTLIAGTRNYTGKDGARTSLARITGDGKFEFILTLPSDHDTSYPGMVIKGDKIYISYYSGHEGKTSIFLATLWLKPIQSR